MGAAPYYDDEELAALGRRPVGEQAGDQGPGRRPHPQEGVRRRWIRLTHDPLCSSEGAVTGERCDECSVIIRTRVDDLRRQRAMARLRARAVHPAGRARGEQLELWGDF